MNPAAPTPASPPNPFANPRTSRLAVASLVLGILGFLILPALAGLICGILAMVRINRSQGSLRGMGVAIAGTTVSGIMLLLIPVFAITAAIMLPALAKAKVRATEIRAISNAKMLGLAVRMYAGDNQDVFPSRTNWCEALFPYLGATPDKVFLTPSMGQPPMPTSAYGLNVQVAGLKTTEVDPQTVVVFELENPGWNVSGGQELLKRSTPGSGGLVVGFADGHAESIRPSSERLHSLRWKP